MKTFICNALLLPVLLMTQCVYALNNTLTFATIEWPPFYSSKMPQQGFVTAITREAFHRAGYQLNIEFTPWSRALNGGKKGLYDGLLGAYHESQRLKYFEYSQQIYQVEESFFKKRGANIVYRSLEDLKYYRIAAIKDGVPANDLIRLGFNVVPITYQNVSIKMLASDRFDLLLLATQPFYHLTRDDPQLAPLRGSLEKLTPPYKTFKIYNVFSKAHPDAVKRRIAFDAALSEMKSDGTFEQILKSFGVRD